MTSPHSEASNIYSSSIRLSTGVTLGGDKIPPLFLRLPSVINALQDLRGGVTVPRVSTILTAFERIRVRKKINLPKLSAYGYRHKIATALRKARLPFDVREMQLERFQEKWNPVFRSKTR